MMMRMFRCLVLVCLSVLAADVEGFIVRVPHQLLSATPAPHAPKIWAFLVAGSSGYFNYRHQADVCHAYQVLHDYGLPDERIIVMMADDIAHSSQNPTPGEIINGPGGRNVYPGVPKDYTGKELNVQNFLNVLSGNKTAMKNIGSGRVIESGPDDIIFLNFVDHGGPGVLCFDEEVLTADVLLDTITSMNKKSQFSKLFMYIEACHAGSMFDDLLGDNMNIFALTAADPFESSYACYYDEERNTYLGDVFSVSWLYDAEHESIEYESIHHMFEKVRTMTNTSHVEEYGDLTLGDTFVAEILGFSGDGLSQNSLHYEPMKPISSEDVASSFDVPLETLTRMLKKELDPERRELLKVQKYHMVKARSVVDTTMSKLVSMVTVGSSRKRDIINNSNLRLGAKNFPCYKKVMSAFSDHCFHIGKNPYVRTHLNKLVNMCAVNWLKLDDIIKAIDHACDPVYTNLPTIY